MDECLAAGTVSSNGPEVERFEEAFARRVDAPVAVACSSGTSALHVALLAAGVTAGDEVFVSDFTFAATVHPVSYVGARPLLVDADARTWNMAAELVAEELDRRAARGLAQPKAVLVAHVLGLAADIQAIAAACDRHGVLLLEDAAQAVGVRLADSHRQLGTFGAAGCFSFNGNKIITSAGGGMLVSADAALAARARHLTMQARVAGFEYEHDMVGYNYRMTALAAALGLAQLQRLDAFIARKLEIASRYDEALAALPGLTFLPRPAWLAPTLWLYSVLVDPATARLDRVALAAHLAKAGIQTRALWTPMHAQPSYRAADRLGGALADRLHAEGLSLPCSTGLTDLEQSRVIDTLHEALR